MFKITFKKNNAIFLDKFEEYLADYLAALVITGALIFMLVR